MYHLAYIVSFLLGVGHGAGTPGTKPRGIECLSCCRWEYDGTLWRIDCVDLGLRDIPSNLSVFTSYLDLSMNNLSALPAHTLSHLHFLRELRLAGNGLTDVPKDVFTGLLNLKVLMLHNNHLKQVPSEALQNLRNLQSLHLDANLIAFLPPTSFNGLVSLRHLWLNDNALTQVPVRALASLPALQAVTLALNRIAYIPDKAFDNLKQLVVLDLHNNQIRSLGKRCFDGLHNLETLDLNCNRLDTFPIAIRTLPNLRELNLHSNNIKSIPEYAFIGNPSLETINVHNNPIRFVGRSAFQNLPELRTLSLNGATDITAFPDLTGTNRLETLTITGTRISSVPSAICEHLPNLQKLDLSHNLIQRLPSLGGCSKIQRIDLSFNQLSSFSLVGLQGLTHLRLSGNLELRDTIPLHKLPRLRVAEMPFAFQCCVFVSTCDKPKCPYSWALGSVDNIGKHSLAQLETYFVTTHVDHVPEDLVVEIGVEARPQPAVRCYPTPGPFQPCQNLLGSWLVHLSVWIIFILSIVFSSLALVSIFLSTSKTPTHHLLGALFWVHLLTGLSTTILAVVDAKTIDHCGAYDLRERGAAPRVTDFLFTLSSEVCLFLMVAVVFERRRSIYDFNCPKARKSVLGRGGVRGISAVCCTLALAIAALPLIVGEYSLSSQCVAFSNGHSICFGYNTALVVLDFLCYLLMTVTHNVPRYHKEKVMLMARSDYAVTKLVTFLLLTNCLIFFFLALLSLSSLFQLPSLHSQEITRSIMLLFMALPTCVDPLLYMFLSPQFREELYMFIQA